MCTGNCRERVTHAPGRRAISAGPACTGRVNGRLTAVGLFRIDYDLKTNGRLARPRDATVAAARDARVTCLPSPRRPHRSRWPVATLDNATWTTNTTHPRAKAKCGPGQGSKRSPRYATAELNPMHFLPDTCYRPLRARR